MLQRSHATFRNYPQLHGILNTISLRTNRHQIIVSRIKKRGEPKKILRKSNNNKIFPNLLVKTLWHIKHKTTAKSSRVFYAILPYLLWLL